MEKHKEIDALSINTIRMLAVDMVEAANSGHPGMPLGAAPMAYTLWKRFLHFNPQNPKWYNRDRFILSAGHGSALLYALLHLSGYDLSLDEIKQFRQWGSKTAGHPEYNETPGVEMTTGPLGQGFATGVGMAIAERYQAEMFNKPDAKLIDHFVYAIVSDGDLMEGVAAEAASLAGHLKLGKLIYLYDDNHISIDGDTELAFSEDVSRRFQAYDWQVLRVEDGNDTEAIATCIEKARQELEKPSLIMVRTRIGFGSPKQDTADVHGAPLGKEAALATKEYFGWADKPSFHVPEELHHERETFKERGAKLEAEWQQTFTTYASKYAELATQFEAQMAGRLPKDWQDDLPHFEIGGSKIATRSASGKVINALAKRLPQLMGGSADLSPSTKTLINESVDQTSTQPHGRNIRFGVREHAMGSIVNGMALSGGLIPYAATFFVFADYMRPAIRMASIMRLPSIFVFTHDSIGLGEDGPTHQPIEHLASLRAMPGLTVMRPADANETAAAWSTAIELAEPVALVLTRQNLPIIDAAKERVFTGVRQGAYVVRDADKQADILLMATGSEVHLALDAAKILQEKNVAARVVSFPSWELFAKQSADYQEEVLPQAIGCRLAIETAASFGWERWLGNTGETLSIDRFGASAPGDRLMQEFGFTVENVVKRAEALLKKYRH